jgi:hypothetical protein
LHPRAITALDAKDTLGLFLQRCGQTPADAVTMKPHQQARTLIVTSRSHGELAHAMSFLRGQHIGERARMLIPEPLYSIHKDALPVAASPYATAEDILGVLDAYQPDLVCLFSAYLFSLENLFSTRSLDTVLRRLRDRGCRVMTSDPFLGLATEVTSGQIDTGMLVPGEPEWRRRLIALLMRVRGSRAKAFSVSKLEDVIHLYPTSIPNRNDGIIRVSFFNPTIVRSSAEPVVDDARRHPRDARPRWLFVLSDSDLHVQTVRVGLSEFLENLLGMLRHAVASERQGTLIAPASIIERLGAGALQGVELLPWRPLDEFEARVVEAEYVFYWNAFSFSQMARLANELPVFLFDRGHFARTVAPYYELARTCHLGGWEPSYLDQRQLFSPYVLAHLAKAQKPVMRGLRERWQLSPSPDALVDQLLSSRPRAETA